MKLGPNQVLEYAEDKLIVLLDDNERHLWVLEHLLNGLIVLVFHCLEVRHTQGDVRWAASYHLALVQHHLPENVHAHVVAAFVVNFEVVIADFLQVLEPLVLVEIETPLNDLGHDEFADYQVGLVEVLGHVQHLDPE